jgi:polyisoprenoid-binding protein YceI
MRCLAMLLLLTAAMARADVPGRGESGQTLIVPEALLSAGDVYHVFPGDDAQITAVSAAPLQRIVVTTRRAVGFFATPYEVESAAVPLTAGALRIPVASLSTGLQSLDDLLAGPTLLNAAEHPELLYEITAVRDVKKADETGKTFDLTAIGKLTVRGAAIDLETPVKLRFQPFTWQSMSRYPGELLTLSAQIELPLQKLGLAAPDRSWAVRLAETIRIDVFLLCNTVSPDKSLDPSIKQPDNVRHLRFLTQLRDFNEPAKAYALGREIMKSGWDNDTTLNRLASDTLNEDGIRQRDLAFALQAATRAVEVSGGKKSDSLSTLAQAHFQRGDVAEAVKWQTKAVEAAGAAPPPVLAALNAALERYKAADGTK